MGERLTRVELTWLLAQEARNAARKLREGVAIHAAPQPTEHDAHVSTTLDTLDDAVNMLVSLHGQGPARGRRGKIDLAALLWEVAPEAQVQIEMGAGVSIFGDEAEVRRILQVLIGQAGDPQSGKTNCHVSIRRLQNEIRICVELGPDRPPTFDMEQEWLRRMASRYGGKLSLDGGALSFTLPASDETNGSEEDRLRKELHAARDHVQRLAEATGKNVAQQLLQQRDAILSLKPPSSANTLGVVAALARSLAVEFRNALFAVDRSSRHDLTEQLSSETSAATVHSSEIVSDLAELGTLSYELPRALDIGEVIQDIVSDMQKRASRRNIQIHILSTDARINAIPVAGFSFVFRSLLQFSIVSSPANSTIQISIIENNGRTAIQLIDEAPPLPIAIDEDLFRKNIDLLLSERANPLYLLFAYSVARELQLDIQVVKSQSSSTILLHVPMHAT